MTHVQLVERYSDRLVSWSKYEVQRDGFAAVVVTMHDNGEVFYNSLTETGFENIEDVLEYLS